MANMSYCRFENTYRDMKDCMAQYQAMFEDPAEAHGTLSREEKGYAKALAQEAAKLIAMVAEFKNEATEDLIEKPHLIATAIDEAQDVVAELEANPDGASAD